MAAAPGGPWMCVECGKVCRSHGGLNRHTSVHKRHPRIGELRDNLCRVYHPGLDGMLSSLSSLTSSNPLKGNRVIQMESFFPLEHHQLPHPQSLLTIGHLLNRVLDSNLRRFYIQRHPSQMVLLTNSLASGVPR